MNPEKNETRQKPLIDGFWIVGKPNGTMKEIAGILNSVSFLEVTIESDAVNVAYVESRDITKKPYVFSLIKITKKGIKIVYSIPPTVAPNKRKLDIIRHFLNILNLIGKYYIVDNRSIYNLIEEVVKNVNELIDKQSTKLYVEYDTLKKELGQIKNKLKNKDEELELLKNKNYELRTESEELKVHLREYESVSDEVLKIKIQDWIKDHNGEINIVEFSNVHNINEGRIEHMLNQLVTEGYLRVVR